MTAAERAGVGTIPLSSNGRAKSHETSDHGMPRQRLVSGSVRGPRSALVARALTRTTDTTGFSQAYANASLERCVWGSDWPHPPEQEKKPDDEVLFDLLLVWVSDENVRHHILVENSEVLYGYR